MARKIYIQWNDDDVRFDLQQHAELDFYSDIHWLIRKSRETLHGTYLFIAYNSYYSVKNYP